MLVERFDGATDEVELKIGDAAKRLFSFAAQSKG